MAANTGSLFREYPQPKLEQQTETQLTPGSEDMSLVQLYIPSEVAHDTIYELGEMSNFQFKDVRYS